MPQCIVEILERCNPYLATGIEAVGIDLEIQARPHADDQVLPVTKGDRAQIDPRAFCEVGRDVCAPSTPMEQI